VGTLTANGYSEYDSVKIKLRIDDDSMKDEIQLYMHEIDDLINNRLRAKLGERNIYGEAIILPLAFDTIPVIPLELKGHANDLVVAKVRLQNSEKPLLWDTAVKVLDNYLERVYGWTRAVRYQPVRTLTISPSTGAVTTVVTIGVTNYQPTAKLTVIFANDTPITTPTEVITDAKGVVTGVTFAVPASQPTGSVEVKVSDSFGGLTERFQVTV
jgi:hypothetical protein